MDTRKGLRGGPGGPIRGSSPRQSSVLGQATFAAACFVCLIVMTHGKPMAAMFFRHSSRPVHEGFDRPLVWLSLVAVSIAFTLLRYVKQGIEIKAPSAVVVALVGPILVQWASSERSALVFFMQVFMCGTFGAIVVLEDLFRRSMVPQFWGDYFSGLSRGIRNVVALFTAGVAVMQYVSEKLNESTEGFMTSLFYPIAGLVLALCAVGYWLMLPAWSLLMKTYQASDADSTGRGQG